MDKVLKYGLIVSIFLSLGALLISLFTIDKLYSPVIGFIGINGLFIWIAATHIRRLNSFRVFGIYLLIYMLVFIWVNHDLNLYWAFRETMEIWDVFYLNPDDYYFYRHVLRTTLIIILIGYGIYHIIRGGDFMQKNQNGLFKINLVVLGVYLLAELPVFDIHRDIGGNNHGHSYWYGVHMH